MKCILLLLCLIATTMAADPPPYKVALDMHNAYRKVHHSPAVAWNMTLQKAAMHWIERCKFDHEPSSQFGENLYGVWFQGQPSAKHVLMRDAVRAWYAEVRKYNYTNPGFSMDTGHFTQVVWKSTKQIGCGIKYCPSFAFVSCKYAPPGNYRGQFASNVVRP
jgi:uncharacterized protein YkwD